MLTSLLPSSATHWISSHKGTGWKGMKHVVWCVRHLQEVREVEHLLGILTNLVDQDGETLQVKGL
jgi:hypothetical protein